MKSHAKSKRRSSHARHAAVSAPHRAHKTSVKATPKVDAPESQASQASPTDADTFKPIETGQEDIAPEMEKEILP
jgi:hypothetical protein